MAQLTICINCLGSGLVEVDDNGYNNGRETCSCLVEDQVQVSDWSDAGELREDLFNRVCNAERGLSADDARRMIIIAGRISELTGLAPRRVADHLLADAMNSGMPVGSIDS